MFNRDKDNLNKDDVNGENCHLVEYTNIVIEGIEKRKKEVCLNFSLLLLLFIGLRRNSVVQRLSIVYSCNSFMVLYSPLAKSPADKVKCNRIDAAVDEAQAEAKDPEDVPEIVVVLLGRWAKVEP